MLVKPIGLIIPTSIEAHDVIRQFRLEKRDGLFQGQVGSQRVLLLISGVGAKNACEAAARLVRNGAGLLVSAGFCGALVPNLRVGDLVTERIRSVDTPARTPEERIQLTQRANAVAVDMETQVIVEEGTRRGVPIRVLRVISDNFETDLTPLFGQDEGFSPWRIGFRLLFPSAWVLGFVLHHNSRIARKRLAEALPEYLPRWAAQIPSA